MSAEDRPKKAAAKKVYRSPSLESFGRLRDLTTGGSGNANEGSQGQRPRP